MKVVVTHSSPDPDAITSVWLIKKVSSGDGEDANIQFVPAGERELEISNLKSPHFAKASRGKQISKILLRK